MNHILDYKQDGMQCLVCGQHFPYATAGAPETCPIDGCGKAWVPELTKMEFESWGPQYRYECPEGHVYYFSFGLPRVEACPKGKIIEDFIYARNLLPPDTWQVSSKQAWEELGERVADLIPKALKVDALFPDGIEHLAERLASIEER